jgi:hypothetical protein
MKKSYKLIAIAAVILSATSCKEFLTITPQDSLVSDNFYTSASALRANTASLYGKGWFDYFGRFMYQCGDMLSGDLYYTYSAEGQFYYNQVGAGNTYNNTGWVGLYRAISFANSIINDMPASARMNGVPEEAINEAIAEARFMRGTAYYCIAEYWGEAPIIANSTELITSSNPKAILVHRNTQDNLYQFACEDLEFAANTLPATDDPGRVTKWSAYGMLCKVLTTRAAYKNDADLYAKAKECALKVIDESGLEMWPDYGTMFDVAANNSSESLFAFQCMVGEYGDGNTRNCEWSRSARIADQTWGAGKNPTLSLQSTFSSRDMRRKWIFMSAGDYYANLDKADGGYTYRIQYRDPDDIKTIVEASTPTLCNVKKYVIGKAADCDGQVGTNQDAGNNIYFLRLTDVYMLYIEDCMGTGSETSDSKAIELMGKVLSRAGLENTYTSISFTDLLKERRKEFALESMSWFDVKRYYYRDPSAALSYLNDMQRDRIYRMVWTDEYNKMDYEHKAEYENNPANYKLSWETLSDSNDYDSRVNNIVFTSSSMYLALPSAVTTSDPLLKEDPVDYYASSAE